MKPAAPAAQVFPVTETYRGERLDKFVQAMLPRMSRASVHEALRERVTLASGLTPKPSRRLVPGDTVTIRAREPEGPTPSPPACLHEGEGWAVFDKPAGMASIPHARHPGADVVSLTGWSPVHRLDLQTSGCLLACDDKLAARHFTDVFSGGRAEKTYGAVVRGVPSRRTWTSREAVGPHPSSRVPGRVTALADDAPGARPACTGFEVVASAGELSLVLARPETGRRHQVRVHLAASGHPILGDLLHGGDEREFVRFQLGTSDETGRHLLHARELTVPTPTGERVTIVAPWPADFPPDLLESAGNTR